MRSFHLDIAGVFSDTNGKRSAPSHSVKLDTAKYLNFSKKLKARQRVPTMCRQEINRCKHIQCFRTMDSTTKQSHTVKRAFPRIKPTPCARLQKSRQRFPRMTICADLAYGPVSASTFNDLTRDQLRGSLHYRCRAFRFYKVAVVNIFTRQSCSSSVREEPAVSSDRQPAYSQNAQELRGNQAENVNTFTVRLCRCVGPSLYRSPLGYR